MSSVLAHKIWNTLVTFKVYIKDFRYNFLKLLERTLFMNGFGFYIYSFKYIFELLQEIVLPSQAMLHPPPRLFSLHHC